MHHGLSVFMPDPASVELNLPCSLSSNFAGPCIRCPLRERSDGEKEGPRGRMARKEQYVEVMSHNRANNCDNGLPLPSISTPLLPCLPFPPLTYLILKTFVLLPAPLLTSLSYQVACQFCGRASRYCNTTRRKFLLASTKTPQVTLQRST